MKLTKSKQCVRWCWKSFCLIFFCRKNFWRDIIALGILIALIAVSWNSKKYVSEIKDDEADDNHKNSEEQLSIEQEKIQQEALNVAQIQSQIDTSTWAPYKSTYYGFSLKYPSDWLRPVAEKPGANDLWEQKFNFRINRSDEANPFSGFEVKLYNVSKVKELSQTAEFPKLMKEELRYSAECADIAGHLLETGNYPAEEIYIPLNDACYNPTLFFTNTRDAYIYIITPKTKEELILTGDPSREIALFMPEFFSVASSWELIEIQRPKPVPPKPKITAPKPVSYKVVGGRLVCDKKNDKPSKSDKNKKKHLDMECCLDPDEYPNPWCTYDPQKYGKYL